MVGLSGKTGKVLLAASSFRVRFGYTQHDEGSWRILRCEVIEEFTYTIPKGVDGALGGFAK